MPLGRAFRVPCGPDSQMQPLPSIMWVSSISSSKPAGRIMRGVPSHRHTSSTRTVKTFRRSFALALSTGRGVAVSIGGLAIHRTSCDRPR